MIRTLLSRVALKPHLYQQLLRPVYRQLSYTSQFENRENASSYTQNSEGMQVLTLDQIKNKAALSDLSKS